MKKTISLLLVLVLTMSLMAVPALAADETATGDEAAPVYTASLSVDKTAIKAGDTVTVTVTLDQAIENVMLAEFFVQYDTSLFERGEATVGTALTGAQVSQKNVALTGHELKGDGTDDARQKFSINYLNYPEGAAATAGTIATIQFTALKDLTEEAAFTLESYMMEDKDFATLIEYDPNNNSSATVQPEAGAAVKYGDVDGDSDIDTRDAALAYRYVNGKFSTITEDGKVAADVDGDNDVDTRDAALIYRHVNGKLPSGFPAANK